MAYTMIADNKWPFAAPDNVVVWLGSYVIGVAGVCLVGLLVMALAELLVYMIGVERNPGRLLRNASKGLLLLAGLRVAGAGFTIWILLLQTPTLSKLSVSIFQIMLAIAWPLVSSLLAALIFLALGLALKRVLLVIEASKSTQPAPPVPYPAEPIV